MTTIVIGGDVYPHGNINDSFIQGNADNIFHDLLEEISNADLSVVNLECPLVSKDTPIEKAGGAILGADVNAVKGFLAAKIKLINLANNHIFDHGSEGLKETIETIKKEGLPYIGAGMNIEEAKMPFIQEIIGERIVIFSMAEHEYSIADEETPGANPLDIINFVHAIKQYKGKGTFIVLIHGGKEFYPYPSPEMVRRCRFMIDMGADAVICCHTHCPLPWEIYAEKPIIYGLGNLIFEPFNKKIPGWHEGYLAKLITESGRTTFEPIPYFQSYKICGARKMNEFQGKQFLNELQIKSNQLKDYRFLKNQWIAHCLQQTETYMTELFGYNRFMRKISNLSLKLLHSKKEELNALLLTQCETHREVLKTLFELKKSDK